jgi:phosphoenolpyruvate synthase/pyruvate phosphate dikinase
MYILFLDEIDGDATHQMGGKGSNLGKLYKAGFPVPGGFCVTTQVYCRLVDDPEIQKGVSRRFPLPVQATLRGSLRRRVSYGIRSAYRGSRRIYNRCL